MSMINYASREINCKDELRAQINPTGLPDFEGVAIEGKGVFETLSCVSKLVIKALT